MKIPFFSKKQVQAPETKSTVIPFYLQGDSFAGLALTNSRVTAQQAFKFYRNNSAVATAVDLIGDSVKQIQPVLKIGDEFITDHEVIDFLRKPNGFDTGLTFLEDMAKNQLISGNNHLSAIGNVKRPPLEIYPVKSIDISTIQGGDNYPFEYLVTSNVKGRGNYKRTSLPRERVTRFYDGTLKELYHMMGYSSYSNHLEADSPLQAVVLEVKQQIKGRVHNLRMLDSGGRLSMLVTFKDPMDETVHAERKQLIEDQLGGAENAGKIGVISSEDMTIQEFGVNNKDMDYKDLDQMAALATYRRYKVPLPLILDRASTFNNMKTSIPMLYDFAVLPLTDYLFAGLSLFLLPRFGLDVNEASITYNPDSITALMDRRLEQLKSRKEIGVETVNEYRSLLPARKDTEGGDVVLVQGTSMPLQQAGQQSSEVKKKAYNFKSMTKATVRSKDEETAAREAEAERNSDKYEPLLADQKELLFDEMNKLDEVDSLVVSNMTEQVLSDTRPEWIKAVDKNYTETGRQWFDQVVVGGKAFEDDAGVTLDEVLEREAIILTEVSAIEAGTASMVTETVERILTDGGNISDIQAALVSAGVFEAERALRVARTITGSAASLGQLVSGELSGASKKKWRDSGFNVRTAHRERDAEDAVDINGRFSKKLGSTIGPRWPGDPQISAADRINCRCSLTFEE